MKTSGGWSKIPHAITDAMPHMTLPELACTILLVRETYGWHCPWARLTRADFCKLTPIKSRATVGVALNTVEARGFFYRAARRSRWTIWGSKQFWPNWGSKCQNEASKSYPPLATPRNHLPLDNNTPSLTRDENKSMFGQFS